MKVFNKQPLSINEQVDRLCNQGMDIPDIPRAIHKLTHISYYRLSGYWYSFKIENDDGTHRFKDGISLDLILEHYIFDRELRLLAFDAIERFEVSLRNQLSCALCLGIGAHAYLDPVHFSDPEVHQRYIESLRRDVAQSRETFITDYLRKYGKDELPPVWMACKIMSMGQLSRWYALIREPDLRQKIADTYQLDESTFGSFLRHLTPVRNCCAHHGRFWNRRFTVGMKLPKKKPADLYQNFNPPANRYSYNTLVMLAYMMDIINPGHHWKERLGELFARHPHVPERSMGFPEDWRDLPVWCGKVGGGLL